MSVFAWLRDRAGPLRRGRLLGDDLFDFEVVGESYCQDALVSIVGGHTEEGHEFYCAALLQPELNNPCDSNAVAVIIREKKIDHLSRHDAIAMRRALHNAECSAGVAGAVIVGGWRRIRRGSTDEGHFGARLNIAEPLEIEV